MLAANFMGNEVIELLEKPKPENIGPEEVLLKVGYCALCGSDKRLFYEGSSIVPGHEISGEVVEVGDRADVKIGTKVIVYIPLYCGECENCKNGDTNRCLNLNGLVGWQVPGGYQQYIKIPAKNIIALPEDISLQEGVLLLDTIGTPAHGIRFGLKAMGNVPNKAIVIGCGPLGLGSLLVLKSMGIENIYAFDVNEERAKIAEGFGAKIIEQDNLDYINYFPIVVEASGNENARKLALNVVKAGGFVLLLGESNKPFIIQPSPSLRRKDCYYVRTFYFPLTEVEENFKLFRKGRGDFNSLVSNIGSLQDIEAMHKEFCAGKTIKPLVQVN
jgi:threonine dehydrogenase-like Zn-dependent dehydrogenase